MARIEDTKNEIIQQFDINPSDIRYVSAKTG